jgi:epoxyqueuosine reductase
MLCQIACPVDRKLLDWIGEQEEFSEEETGLFLKGVKPSDLPDTTMKKVARLSLVEDIERFPRNLGVFYKGGSI